ncbi:MAG: chromosome segregation protein SMC [Actinomycetaceae bacterium]|nr:chromosome segregation protein SMC [Actinomycetaceae bacterium]
MFVKSLTLRGFKSFASQTTMEFQPGIIAIIGPNGSGKSNIVDALGWVMGEQGAKNLRGQAMSDVIFAGTAQRAGLGRAQVELCIDNSSGDLPIDFTEVTISRTVFRSGGSEYSLNGSPCRLLDIQELLSDTGMGKNMHVIVGQGQLDEVLSADPLVRRSYIEEAAGVLKHRRRKERALSKLDSTMDKLSRLEDLTREIRRQMGPLSRQAKAAQQASVIQATIRDASSRLQADSIARARDELAERLRQRDAIHRQRQELRATIDSLETKLQTLDGSSKSSDGSTMGVDALTALWHQQSQLHTQCQSFIQLAQERSQALSRPIGGAVVDNDAFQHMIAEANHRIARAQKDQDTLQARISEQEKQRDRAEKILEDASDKRSRWERAVGDHREQLARLEGEREALKSQLRSLREQLQQISVQRNDAAGRSEKAHRALKELPAVNDAKVKELSAYHAELVGKHKKSDQELDAQRSHYQRLHGEYARWESRKETISASIASHNGSDELLGAKLDGINNTFASAITIAHGWEDACAAFLGDKTDALVAVSEDAAVNALRYARTHGTGKVNLIYERRVGKTSGETYQLPHDLPDYAHPLSSLLSAKNPQLQEVLTYLCARAVAVQDLDQALSIVNTYPELTVVTRHGETVGAVYARGGTEETLLRLHSQLSEAEEHCKDLRSQVEAIKAEVEKREDNNRNLATKIAQILEQIRHADALHTKEAEQAARVNAEIQLADAEVERLDNARKEIEKRISHEQEKVEKQEKAVCDCMQQAPSLEDSAESLQKDYEQASENAREARQKLTDLQLEKRSADERAQAAKNHRKALETQWEERREQAKRQKRREEQRRKRVEVLGSISDISVRAHSLSEQLYELTSHYRRQAVEQQEKYQKNARELRITLQETTRSYDRRTDEVHQHDVAAAEHRLRVEQLEERARQELHIEPHELIADYGPHMLIPVDVVQGDAVDDDNPKMVAYVRSEQEERLAAAQKKLSRLGTINPLAMEEYKALEQRYEFMTAQVADVKKSRTDLLHIIDEVDQQVKHAFEQAYHDTAESFEHVFAQLFPGGQGRLVLTDPDKWLDTGVEIEARPAGKKVKRLSLLSGGERSLSALAFLIALFKARPSPFYILDEVEAALDDVNLSRVLKVFEELREISQLLVITHQKRTMAIADSLYGVSMRDGITKVVSHKLTTSD